MPDAAGRPAVFGGVSAAGAALYAGGRDRGQGNAQPPHERATVPTAEGLSGGTHEPLDYTSRRL